MWIKHVPPCSNMRHASPLDFYLHPPLAILMAQRSLLTSIHWAHLRLATLCLPYRVKNPEINFSPIHTNLLRSLWSSCLKNRSVIIALFTFYLNILIGPKCTPRAPHEQKSEGGAQNCCKSADLREQVGVTKIIKWPN